MDMGLGADRVKKKGTDQKKYISFHLKKKMGKYFAHSVKPT